MKVHYINILLFALPLNILVYNQRNYYITPRHTETNRSLCECELYSPANYDSDPEMKRVMQQFEDRTTQRFHEYDERMKTTRQKCKDKYDKEIQNIILKDKIEKQMAQQLTTLETKITTEDIPTCICEKSLADKTEKFCLNCGVQLGGGVMPSIGLLGGIGQLGLDAWKAAALVTAKELAEKAGAAAGLKAGDALGMEIVTLGLRLLKVDTFKSGIYKTFVTTKRYSEVTGLVDIIDTQINASCNSLSANKGNAAICALRGKLGVEAVPGGTMVNQKDAITNMLNEALKKATKSAEELSRTTAENVAAELTAQKTGAINTIFMSKQTAIIASIVAIVVIVLIMVIIYLILRYRRKKKMKKKLQYIKLLEE
ncbi:surface antigen [Plasmodium falciparum UGT5.1]|uniref:Surface antigen n=1 Tax=Plasmodium falciparum UGT5.1 TaxID=1237627 RepID=W7JK72_PLAFA|nr:surface antigen [Plasmodium falciparum UGT5.1]